MWAWAIALADSADVVAVCTQAIRVSVVLQWRFTKQNVFWFAGALHIFSFIIWRKSTSITILILKMTVYWLIGCRRPLITPN